MHNEYIKRGEILPKIFPSGFNNPMGDYALYLGKHYAIHGTANNQGNNIGLRVTRGCIRLRPKDIEYLFTMVPIGTPVRFINEPIKFTTDLHGRQYIEIHHPLFKINRNKKNTQLTKSELKKIIYLRLKNVPNINYKIVDQAIDDCSGIPINVTNQ